MFLRFKKGFNVSSKRKCYDLMNNPKVKRQKSVLKCNICYLICYSVSAMKNHIRSDHEGKSTSSFTDVDEPRTEDGKTSSKKNTVKKEVASKNLVELVDNILKSNTESSISEKKSYLKSSISKGNSYLESFISERNSYLKRFST